MGPCVSPSATKGGARDTLLLHACTQRRADCHGPMKRGRNGWAQDRHASRVHARDVGAIILIGFTGNQLSGGRGVGEKAARGPLHTPRMGVKSRMPHISALEACACQQRRGGQHNLEAVVAAVLLQTISSKVEVHADRGHQRELEIGSGPHDGGEQGLLGSDWILGVPAVRFCARGCGVGRTWTCCRGLRALPRTLAPLLRSRSRQ